MDDWRSKLASNLLGTKAGPSMENRFAPSAAQQLTIAFGHARTEVNYLLSLGRTNNLPVKGDVLGDDVFLQLGAHKLHIAVSRPRGAILVEGTGREPTILTYDAQAASFVLPTGARADAQAFIHAAVESLVAAWKAAPGPLPGPQWPPPQRARVHGAPPYHDAPPPGHIEPPKALPAPQDAPSSTPPKPSP